MFALLFGLMYLLFIRPQSKRRREAQEMQRQLGVGDQIITIGGLYGTVTDSDDESLTLEIAPGINARYARQSVARVITSVAASAESDVATDSTPSAVQETKKAD